MATTAAIIAYRSLMDMETLPSEDDVWEGVALMEGDVPVEVEGEAEEEEVGSGVGCSVVPLTTTFSVYPVMAVAISGVG